VIGIHIEGPHLDVVRKGAHDTQFIRPMTDADATLYKANDCGTTMVTLAPNRVPPERIAELVHSGVIVSLGHSDATFEQVEAALKAGATSFTHMFNAMSQVTPRDPGMVGAALANAEAYLGVIADGHHVHDVNLRMAIKAKGSARVMLVTDAMPTAAGGPSFFALQGRLVKREGTKLVLTDGTLAGSDLTMDQALRHTVEKLGFPIVDALRMASLTPATFLRHGHELGRIRPGYLASLVHLDASLRVKHCWVEGKEFSK
jgi:N-acetylglucosamine-6-phosphate deacetylase